MKKYNESILPKWGNNKEQKKNHDLYYAIKQDIERHKVWWTDDEGNWRTALFSTNEVESLLKAANNANLSQEEKLEEEKYWRQVVNTIQEYKKAKKYQNGYAFHQKETSRNIEEFQKLVDYFSNINKELIKKLTDAGTIPDQFFTSLGKTANDNPPVTTPSNDTKTCPRCHQLNPVNSKFCKRCGESFLTQNHPNPPSSTSRSSTPSFADYVHKKDVIGADDPENM